MIKVTVKRKNSKINELVVKGHADYDISGKDIVCAAVSSMTITTINNIIALDDSISYEEKSGLLKIRTKKDTEINTKLLDNLVRMLKELSEEYPRNLRLEMRIK